MSRAHLAAESPSLSCSAAWSFFDVMPIMLYPSLFFAETTARWPMTTVGKLCSTFQPAACRAPVSLSGPLYMAAACLYVFL